MHALVAAGLVGFGRDVKGSILYLSASSFQATGSLGHFEFRFWGGLGRLRATGFRIAGEIRTSFSQLFSCHGETPS